jgi:hypothetical protein|tara:strand:- start:103 stop:294 length:192 start_codon:yes stop_codon:yes gene_type:complete
VLAETSINRRTIWVKAKMPGFQILSAFQLRLKENNVPDRWITLSSSGELKFFHSFEKCLKHGE